MNIKTKHDYSFKKINKLQQKLLPVFKRLKISPCYCYRPFWKKNYNAGTGGLQVLRSNFGVPKPNANLTQQSHQAVFGTVPRESSAAIYLLKSTSVARLGLKKLASMAEFLSSAIANFD